LRRSIESDPEEMTMHEDLRPAELQEIDRVNCMLLLATQRVGRLVLPGAEPFVAPMNYVVVGETLLYRSDEGSRAAGTHGAHVVFEVDVVDDREQAGWSVVVRGTAEDVTELVSTDPELRDRLEPWAPGPKDRWLRVHVQEVTGRTLRGAEQPSPLDIRGYV
jgi:uncharacterized protein